MQGCSSESTTFKLDPRLRALFPPSATEARLAPTRAKAGFGGQALSVTILAMKRGMLVAIAGTGLLASAVFAWSAVRQEREFRRLIAVGDAAITRDQTYEAIEAFSGALALKHDSMLAYLNRGDRYRRRGELIAAL